MAQAASGPQREGLEMLHLREMFQQERPRADPAKRADLHHQIIEYARAREDEQGRLGDRGGDGGR